MDASAEASAGMLAAMAEAARHNTAETAVIFMVISVDFCFFFGWVFVLEVFRGGGKRVKNVGVLEREKVNVKRSRGEK
jgi:hypothetical protein